MAIMIEIQGITASLKDHARIAGIPRSTLSNRYHAAIARGEPITAELLRPATVRSVNRAPGNPFWEKAYRAWSSMKSRCQNPKHPRYRDWGGRGIQVAEEFQVFDRFLEEVGYPPALGLQCSIDRIDNDRGYEPGNVRWATPKQQRANCRPGLPSHTRLVTVDGVTRTLREWAAHSGLKLGTIRDRIADYGWSPERAVTEPVNSTPRGRQITIGDRAHTVREWAEISGLKPITIYKRLEAGWQGPDLISPPCK